MKYVVFGAGNSLLKILNKLKENACEICAIVDNDSSKWGKKIQDIEIKSVELLSKMDINNNRIIISVENIEAKSAIKEQLKNMGFFENRDFFSGTEFLLKNNQMPGRVSGVVELESGYTAVKTFDPASRLIKKKDENKIYRVVSYGYEQSYMNVYELCKKNGLLGNEIIDTHIVKKRGSNRLIFEHKYVVPVSYCFEWAPMMIFDYVEFMLGLFDKLADAGLGLADGHVLNATIHQGKFTFLDFGGIKAGNTENRTLIEFINTHMLPLILFGRCQPDKAYMHLKNPGIEFTVADVQGYLDSTDFQKLKNLYDVAITAGKKDDIKAFCAKARMLLQLFRNEFSKTQWIGYQDDEWELSSNRDQWSTKMENAISLIEKVKPSTVIDMAGNMGWYGSYLHENLEYSIIMDFDSACIDNLWKRCKENRLKNVLPLYMSICAPTLDYYRDEPIGKSGLISWRTSAVERMQADLVIALAIVHHLAFRQQLSFEEIIGQFELFSKKYLLIEFVSKEDRYITDFQKEGFDWYTEDNFVCEIEKKFNILDKRKSTPEETRIIYMCEKRCEE